MIYYLQLNVSYLNEINANNMRSTVVINLVSISDEDEENLLQTSILKSILLDKVHLHYNTYELSLF